MTAWSLIWIAAIVGTFITATATKVLTELSWHELQEYCRLRKLTDQFDNIHDHADSVARSTEALQIMENGKFNALLVVDDDKHLIGALNMHDLLRAGVV